MDLEQVCRDCGQSFTVSDGEREFYIERGMYVPKRCKPCRAARRQAADEADRAAHANRLT